MRLIRMFYELAFTIEPGSIVLLDGIDRSFGPVWQQNLLQDLDAMARLRGNRYLCTSYTSLPQQHPDRVIHIQNS